MKKYNFSIDDQYTIAEFIYSYSQDILIQPDAIDLVKVLFRHEILYNMNSWIKDIQKADDKVATKLINLLEANIAKEEIQDIMREYYGIKF